MPRRLLPLLSLAFATALASVQATERHRVATRDGLVVAQPITVLCTSPQTGREGLEGAITLPARVEPACDHPRVRAHVEWTWGVAPGAAALHAYWVKDAGPLREAERQLRADGWTLEGRWPSPQGEQVRYAKPGQDIMLHYDDPLRLSYPEYQREGRFLWLRLRRF